MRVDLGGGQLRSEVSQLFPAGADEIAGRDALVLWLVSSVTYSCWPSGNGLILVLVVPGELDQEFVQVRPRERPLKRPGNRFVVRLEVQQPLLHGLPIRRVIRPW